jgi:hypothetical protein
MSPDASVGGPGAGTFSLTQFRSSTTPNSVIAGVFVGGASIEQLAEGAFDPTCRVMASSGACRFLQCTSPATFDSAGTVTVSIGGTEIATLLPIVGGGYAQFHDIVAQPGDSVTTSASGEIVPAFMGSVRAPGALTTTLPTSVPRTAPLSSSWTTSAPADRMQLLLRTTAGSIACTIEAAAATLTIPSELLAMLPATAGAELTLTAYDSQQVSGGDYTVLLTVGDAVRGTVSVE